MRHAKRQEGRVEPQVQPEPQAQAPPDLSCELSLWLVHFHARASRSPRIYQTFLKPLWTPPHSPDLPFEFFG